MKLSTYTLLISATQAIRMRVEPEQENTTAMCQWVAPEGPEAVGASCQSVQAVVEGETDKCLELKNIIDCEAGKVTEQQGGEIPVSEIIPATGEGEVDTSATDAAVTDATATDAAATDVTAEVPVGEGEVVEGEVKSTDDVVTDEKVEGEFVEGSTDVSATEGDAQVTGSEMDQMKCLCKMDLEANKCMKDIEQINEECEDMCSMIIKMQECNEAYRKEFMSEETSDVVMPK